MREAVSKSTGERAACKVIDKSKLPNPKMLENEVRIMKRIRHENIVKLYDEFETETNLFLVMEPCSGGELFDRIIEKGWYSEKEAREVIRAVVKAVQFLHENGIMHRDLKPENVLFSDKADDAEVKLADFGFSTAIEDASESTMDCGTVEYVAPEILCRQQCTIASDLWSIGVILYILLCGFHPFYDEDRSQFIRLIVQAKYSFPDPEWTSISPEAKDLIGKLLVVDPAGRLTAEEVLKHPWIASVDVAPDKPLPVDNMREYASRRLRTRRNRRYFERLAPLVRNTFGDDNTDAYEDFMRATKYDHYIDSAISAAIFGVDDEKLDQSLSAPPDATDVDATIIEQAAEFLDAFSSSSENDLLESISGKVFPDDENARERLVEALQSTLIKSTFSNPTMSPSPSRQASDAVIRSSSTVSATESTTTVATVTPSPSFDNSTDVGGVAAANALDDLVAAGADAREDDESSEYEYETDDDDDDDDDASSTSGNDDDDDDEEESSAVDLSVIDAATKGA